MRRALGVLLFASGSLFALALVCIFRISVTAATATLSVGIFVGAMMLASLGKRRLMLPNTIAGTCVSIALVEEDISSARARARRYAESMQPTLERLANHREKLLDMVGLSVPPPFGTHISGTDSASMLQAIDLASGEIARGGGRFRIESLFTVGHACLNIKLREAARLRPLTPEEIEAGVIALQMLRRDVARRASTATELAS